MNKIIGIFGATFSPPTLGHKDAIKQAFSLCHEIILVPSFRHGFFKKQINYTARMEMTYIFARDIFNQFDKPINVSEVEKDLFKLNSEQPVYTYNVMSAFEELYKNEKNITLCFIRGPDNAELKTWQKFYRHTEIEERWLVFTAKQRINVRSTEVRNIMKKNSSVVKKQLTSSYITENVYNYIVSNGLYV